MTQLQYPPSLIAEAQALGVSIGDGDSISTDDALDTLEDELDHTARMNGDVKSSVRFRGDTFGFSIAKAVKGVTSSAARAVGQNPMRELGKKSAWYSMPLTPSKIATAVRNTATPQGVVSFGVPPGTNMQGALSKADQLLGDRKITNAALIVRNTKALAALGDDNAKRGLTVLSAAAKIRTAKKTPPGKAAVPPSAKPVAVVQKTSPAQIKTLVKTAPPKPGVLRRFINWIESL